MEIKVIKRGHELQITTLIPVGPLTMNVSVERTLSGDDLQAEIEAGQAELLAKVRLVLESIAERGRCAQQLLDEGPVVQEVRVMNPRAGQGICRVCHEVFDQHGLLDTSELCLNHIDPNILAACTTHQA